MSRRRQSIRAFFVLSLFGLLLSGIQIGKARAAVSCTKRGIQAIAPANTTITSAAVQSSPAAYCDVLGYVTTTNPGPNQDIFELALPASWNGRFIFVGNLGFAGGLATTAAPANFAVQYGFAGAITDTGHESPASSPVFDATFALNNLAAQDDWLYRSVHAVTVASKAIMQAYYTQQALVHTYFVGYSTGGRQAMVEAQQFPNDFDGIAANRPALGDYWADFNRDSEQVTATPANFIPGDKLALVDKTVLNTCDGTDGVIDGLIQDPRACNFDPQSLQCSGAEGPSCLTAGEVATFKAVYKGAGKIYPGFTVSDPASEPATQNGWDSWITGLAAPDAPGTAEPWTSLDNAPGQFIFQDQFLKYFVFGDASYNSLTFNVNDPSQLAQLQAVATRGGADGTIPDLSAFSQRGGKLTIFHGWSDAAVTPLDTVQYYMNLAGKMGGIAATKQFARLFMLPGTQHCGGGPGPDVWNGFVPVLFWVENGTVPDQLPAYHFQNDDPSTGVVTRSMPLCAYPNQAKYIGGDVNQLSSWTCPGS
jgi:feruloyl esterase